MIKEVLDVSFVSVSVQLSVFLPNSKSLGHRNYIKYN